MLMTADLSDRVYTLDFVRFFKVLYDGAVPADIEYVDSMVYVDSFDFSSPSRKDLFVFLMDRLGIMSGYSCCCKSRILEGGGFAYDDVAGHAAVFEEIERTRSLFCSFRLPNGTITSDYHVSERIWHLKRAIDGDGDLDFRVSTGEKGVAHSTEVLLRRLPKGTVFTLVQLSNPSFYPFTTGDVVRWSKLACSVGRVVGIERNDITKVVRKDGSLFRVKTSACRRTDEPFAMDDDASDFLDPALINAVEEFTGSDRVIMTGKCPECGASLSDSPSPVACRCGTVYCMVPEFGCHVSGGKVARQSVETSGFVKCCDSCKFYNRHSTACNMHGSLSAGFLVCKDWVPSLVNFQYRIMELCQTYRCRHHNVPVVTGVAEAGVDSSFTNDDILAVKKLENVIKSKVRQLTEKAKSQIEARRNDDTSAEN